MSRIFALIIGIDTYKSGNIWNLHSCVDDAKRMKQWLTNDLEVPKQNIQLLLDNHATKRNIEDLFMGHLVNNPGIERSDSIIFYFAGHGSRLPAPEGWFQRGERNRDVEILCPYDHDTKLPEGRNAGISDRSLIALIEELASSKGDNITVILDCCFSPAQTPANIRERHLTRWTKTSKATPEDLYNGLWITARGKPHFSGLFDPMSSHILLAACSAGQKALEGKEGGRFTTSLLHAASTMPLHRTSYAGFIDHLRWLNGETQQFVCVGKNKSRNLFDDVPFAPDNRFSPAFLGDNAVQVQLGSIHGIVEGSTLSLHLHNYHRSPNPPIAQCVVTDVHPTFSYACTKFQSLSMPDMVWAKVTNYNNLCHFKVYLKSTFLSIIRLWKLIRTVPCTPQNTTLGNGVSVQRVKDANMADLFLELGPKPFFLVQNKPVISQHENSVIEIQDTDGIHIIDDAAKFNLHLVRKNLEKPFQNLVGLDIQRVDPSTWKSFGSNFLQNGIAIIPYQKGEIYNITLHNYSNIDIWPYLLYMDPVSYSSTMLYNPDPSLEKPPLPRHGSLDVGVTRIGSDELPIVLDEKSKLDFKYIKLFLSTAPVNLSSLERQTPLQWFSDTHPRARHTDMSPIWDTALASLVFIRPQDKISMTL